MCKIPANVAGERLTFLYHKNQGSLTPEIVVKDAKAESSPLHSGFEWDNKKAAEKYRIGQARGLINSLIIEIEKPDEKSGEIKTLEVRVFHNIRTDSNPYNHEAGSRYVLVSDAMADPSASEYLLQKAYSDLVAYRDKYSILSELKPRISMLNEIIEELKAKQDQKEVA